MYKRLTANVQINFFYDNEIYEGTLVNLSENGMLINTGTSLHRYKSEFIVHITFEKSRLIIPVKVIRLIKENGSYNGIGVELLLKPKKKYLEFMSSL